MKSFLRLVLLGILTWIVPFIASFLFYDRSGQLTTNIYLFKSVMIVIGVLTGSIAIVLFYKKIRNNFVRQGIIAGITWFLLNILLDILILLPMSKMTESDYLQQIGIRYLVIPIMCILCGYLLNKKLAIK